jgi:hypothetical protein
MLCPLRQRQRPCAAQAEAEKQRLEQKQRLARLAAAAGEGQPFQPRWFRQLPGGTQQGAGLVYQFTGGYWEARATGQLKGLGDDIFV